MALNSAPLEVSMKVKYFHRYKVILELSSLLFLYVNTIQYATRE